MNKILVFAMILIVLPTLAFATNDEDDWIPLQQGSFSVRIGGFMPRGESDIWDENVEYFTMEVDDFNSFMVGAEFNWFLNKYITVGLAVDVYTNTENTEYRDFIGDDGLPIEQEIKLTIVPITTTVKFMPLGNGAPGYGGERGSPIVPWIGGGIGAYAYTYEEFGEFIEFPGNDIIIGDFYTDEDAAAFGFHLAAGLIVPVGLEWDVFGEVRYAIVEGDLGPDFVGFDPIDLGGLSFIGGASYRF